MPNTILDKPGKLDDAEFEAIKLHPVFTQQILSRVPAFARLAGSSAAHHERLNGSGYPNGLAAGQLTPYARVLAVADVYEALTADRPYRDGHAGRAGARDHAPRRRLAPLRRDARGARALARRRCTALAA